MPISKTDSCVDNHPVLLAMDKWWVILIRNGFNSTAKINVGDFSQSGHLSWFPLFIFSIQWRLIATIGHSIKCPQSRCIPHIIKTNIPSHNLGMFPVPECRIRWENTEAFSPNTNRHLWLCCRGHRAVFRLSSPNTCGLDTYCVQPLLWEDTT